MTDLVAELRRRAKVHEENADDRDLPSAKSYSEGTADAYKRSADLLETDPLFKATKPAIDLLREFVEWDEGHDANRLPFDRAPAWVERMKRGRAFLDSLPKNYVPAPPFATETALFERFTGEAALVTLFLRLCDGKWMLIHGSDFLGFYDTRENAYAEGLRKVGNVPMLIRQFKIPKEAPP